PIQYLLCVIAVEMQNGVVRIQQPSVQSRVRLGIFGALVDSSETFLNLSILILAPFALGHVTDSAGDQYPFLGLQRAQADLHRKLTPVLPPPVKFQPRPHGSRARISKIARAVPGMRSSKPRSEERRVGKECRD